MGGPQPAGQSHLHRDRLKERTAADSDHVWLEDYLRRADAAPVLTRERELELVALSRRGDAGAGLALLGSQMRLVVFVAKKYESRVVLSSAPNEFTPVTLARAVRLGHGGMEAALGAFDPSSGFRLATYATWWIRTAITKGIAGQTDS